MVAFVRGEGPAGLGTVVSTKFKWIILNHTHSVTILDHRKSQISKNKPQFETAGVSSNEGRYSGVP